MAPSHNVFLLALTLFTSLSLVSALKYDPDYVDYNLNTNKLATSPLDYSGNRDKTNHTKSPANWRFPYYTIFLDRFVNGDPTNDNANNTFFEQDMTSNQLRHGGDLQGLLDSLDYIQGMGVKVREDDYHANAGDGFATMRFMMLTCSRVFTLPVHHSSMRHGAPTPTR